MTEIVPAPRTESNGSAAHTNDHSNDHSDDGSEETATKAEDDTERASVGAGQSSNTN